MRVKIAVVAPIPNASVITAVVVNPGAFRSCRNASRKSASIRPSQSHLVGSTRKGGRRFPATENPVTPEDYFWFPHKGRVPHISLVFREMWDTTDVDR